MIHLKQITGFTACIGMLVVSVNRAYAVDIGGTISSTLTITEDSQLVDDVTCTVTGAACIAIGAPHLTLELNGFTITGQADPQTACNGGPTTFVATALEDAIDLQTQTDATIRGPGLVQRFRGPGIFLNKSSGIRVTGVTVSTNCLAGILVGGGSDNDIRDNVSVRNGSGAFPCGGIWLYGGSSRNRLRGNRTSANGYSAQGNNFGIGLENAGTNDNIVEENTVVGNTNGLFMTAGVKGNTIRRNLIVGNPPVQVDLDHTSANGWDVKNLADDGANTFTHNVCLTAVNAPCPAIGRQPGQQ